LTLLVECMCTQYLTAKLVVTFGLIALYLAVLGLGITSIDTFRSFPWWAPATLPILSLVICLLWIELSRLGYVRSRWTPWAFISSTFWLDAVCISQESEELNEVGNASTATFLRRSENMIAFVSPKYFQRLWSVYELATFCKLHHEGAFEGLDEKLLLLSLEWPRSSWRSLLMGCIRAPVLSEDEAGMLRNFCCTNMMCSKPRDRAFVLQAIREQWGSETAFDQFVRDEMPGIMLASKRKYHLRHLRAMDKAFEMLFSAT